jgi:hypothetical protein
MEQFFEKIKSNPALKKKYEAILKKHEAAKDRDAVAAELAELARAEGFAATPGGVLSALAPKGEISEEELEAISGGGSPMALCLFAVFDSMGRHGPMIEIYDVSGSHKRLCSHSGDLLCTWVGCACHGDINCCRSGYHYCDETGKVYHGRR